ncbi:MAG: hypothetical protein EPO10_26000 [Reyranella sp.]|uniref:hypothetical protein n=1 Tax=Reyranella sp. TaxID=1929291 RepID=UPI0012065AA8|nr:hypothetical protein [Reyranella sp.]TAJ97245.1 MAG: hypothetical protein EPO41_04425 [Reyranella sp.]TBR24070.1 MAG: hypothetical protein EPO10_26000 [Reyranella sp.]
MQKVSTALVIGSLALMPLSAMGQNLASAPSASPMVGSDHLVFMGSNGNRVPESAMQTVRAAADAARQSPVRIEGRADYANALKQELVRQGAPAGAISVTALPVQPLPKAGDGLSVPTDRGVILRF